MISRFDRRVWGQLWAAKRRGSRGPSVQTLARAVESSPPRVGLSLNRLYKRYGYLPVPVSYASGRLRTGSRRSERSGKLRAVQETKILLGNKIVAEQKREIDLGTGRQKSGRLRVRDRQVFGLIQGMMGPQLGAIKSLK